MRSTLIFESVNGETTENYIIIVQGISAFPEPGTPKCIAKLWTAATCTVTQEIKDQGVPLNIFIIV